MRDITNPFFVGLVGLGFFTIACCGCDAMSGIVPTGDIDSSSATAKHSETTGNTGDSESQAHSSTPGGASRQPAMAGRNSGSSEMPSPGTGKPAGSDSTAEYADQFSSGLPSIQSPGAGASAVDYVSGGAATLPDPATAGGPPGSNANMAADYLDSLTPVEGAEYLNPENYDPQGNYIGGGASFTGKRAASAANDAETPADEAPGQPGNGVLRNKNPRPATPSSAAGERKNKGGPPATKPTDPAFADQPLFRLSNPVSLFDGTGFSIGFSVEYQLLRAPEAGTTYFWVISFEERSKSGGGSQVRRIQQVFRPTDSSTLNIVVPLTGQPKEPYRCVIAAKKGNAIKQVSRTTTFPPSFK